MKKYKIAVEFKIIKGRIQLFDKDGNKIDGKGAMWEGNFYCSHNNLTSLEGAPEAVGGNFYCSYNNLTSLEGAPENIGGNFYCSGNKLTSLDGAPNKWQPMFDEFLSKGFIFADGILTRLKSKKKISDDLTIYKTEKLGFKENAPIIYVAHDGENFAHAKTLEKAVLELKFKTSDRDTSQYDGLSLDTVKTPDEWAIIYRTITGACQEGVDMFMDSKHLKKKYSLREILEETKGAYGGSTFERFFNDL